MCTRFMNATLHDQKNEPTDDEIHIMWIPKIIRMNDGEHTSASRFATVKQREI